MAPITSLGQGRQPFLGLKQRLSCRNHTHSPCRNYRPPSSTMARITSDCRWFFSGTTRTGTSTGCTGWSRSTRAGRSSGTRTRTSSTGAFPPPPHTLTHAHTILHTPPHTPQDKNFLYRRVLPLRLFTVSFHCLSLPFRRPFAVRKNFLYRRVSAHELLRTKGAPVQLLSQPLSRCPPAHSAVPPPPPPPQARRRKEVDPTGQVHSGRHGGRV